MARVQITTRGIVWLTSSCRNKDKDESLTARFVAASDANDLVCGEGQQSDGGRKTKDERGSDVPVGTTKQSTQCTKNANASRPWKFG